MRNRSALGLCGFFSPCGSQSHAAASSASKEVCPLNKSSGFLLGTLYPDKNVPNPTKRVSSAAERDSQRTFRSPTVTCDQEAQVETTTEVIYSELRPSRLWLGPLFNPLL